MANNKVVFGDNTIMDISDSTVTPENLDEGVVAYDKSGQRITGTRSTTCPVAVGVTPEYKIASVRDENTKKSFGFVDYDDYTDFYMDSQNDGFYHEFRIPKTYKTPYVLEPEAGWTLRITPMENNKVMFEIFRYRAWAFNITRAVGGIFMSNIQKMGIPQAIKSIIDVEKWINATVSVSRDDNEAVWGQVHRLDVEGMNVLFKGYSATSLPSAGAMANYVFVYAAGVGTLKENN